MKQINGYYIDNLPKNNFGKSYSDYEYCNMKAKLFNKKNIHNIDIIAELRMWFKNIKQPTKTQVDKALLLIIDDDYIVKLGGDSKSSTMYSSSLKWLQSNPKTGLDYEPVIMKKYGTALDDVLITFDDINTMFNFTITDDEKNKKLNNDTLFMISLLSNNYRLNKHDSKEAPTEFLLNALSKVHNDIKIKQYNYLIDKREKELKSFIESGNSILGTNMKPCKDRTTKHIDDMKTNIDVLKRIKNLIL